MKWLRDLVFARMCYVIANRAPDFEVGPEGAPYLKRWYLMRFHKGLSIYLHWFLADDYNRALHDHPWNNVSWLISGSYDEIISTRGIGQMRLHRSEGSIVFRRATDAHRIELMSEIVRTPAGNRHHIKKAAFTIFITGPRIRVWGFHCASGWRPFTDVTVLSGDGKRSTIGRGCS